MDSDLLVVIGVGGMGQAIARRQGAGRTVLLADFDETGLSDTAAALAGDGYVVRTRRVDVSDPASVDELAKAAAELGPVTQVAHTAGLSPVQAPADAVLRVDLLGVALVLDAFGGVIAPGGAGVVISSMAGHLSVYLTAEQEEALADTPAERLLELPFVDTAVAGDSAAAYGLAKRANHLRVRAASVAWGERGARINSISPGVISTPMGQQELASEHGGRMRAMVEASAAKRLGTPEDIAGAAAFLLGPEASFVSGTDLLVDGGTVAAIHAGRMGRGAGVN
ncbi:SDR family oxidoreductase [Streptomyces sp. SID13726]|uniref:SDR family oxidoreductase n=1 Tax=Streptomyces sp. SID13726 TaxID=2706058 RepID=UPI0013BADCBA|nr:SDR family oxidoreductase [Streptomyces sp. SID13726]NEA98984.1 SDR family oxidoreductase [Streptomyces sp. SID13726]